MANLLTKPTPVFYQHGVKNIFPKLLDEVDLNNNVVEFTRFSLKNLVDTQFSWPIDLVKLYCSLCLCYIKNNVSAVPEYQANARRSQNLCNNPICFDFNPCGLVMTKYYNYYVIFLQNCKK